MKDTFRNFALLLIFMLGFTICSNLFSQTANLTVTVADESGKPLPGTAVTLKGPDKSEAFENTDDNGIIVFNKLADGSYTIAINAQGYEPRNGKIVITSADKTEYKGPFKLKRIPTAKQEAPKPPPVDTGKVIYYDKTPEAAKPDAVLPPEVKKENVKENVIKVPVLPEEDFKPKPVVQTEEPEEVQVPEKKSFLSGSTLKTILIGSAIFTGFITVLLLILLAVRWKKSGKGGKIVLFLGSLGCGCLTVILIVIIIIGIFTAKGLRQISEMTEFTVSESNP